jgi:hypothetical protein
LPLAAPPDYDANPTETSMTGPHQVSVIPPPLDDDDDDVAWALQTAQVQWKRGAKADAVVWLRRATESAMALGKAARAMQINAHIAQIEELMVADVFGGSAPPPPQEATGNIAVDDLLSFDARKSRASIDVEFEEPESEQTEIVTSRELLPSDLPPPPVLGRLPPPPVPPPERPARPPPPPTHPPAPVSPPPPPHPPGSPGAAPPGVSPAVFDASTVVPDQGSDTVRPSQKPKSFLPLKVPALDAIEEPLAASSRRLSEPAAEATAPPPMEAATEAPPLTEAAPEAAGEALTEAPAESGAPQIRGVSLGDVAGLQDLPPEAQAKLVESARLETLDVDEEVSAFAVALVLEGWVSIMPAIADVACSFAQTGDVVFTHGTLDESIVMRVVAGETDTVVAVWERDALTRATEDFPWVADELRAVADRFQALAGAAMGPLGDRLDDTLRQSVTDRCEVRLLLPHEELQKKGETVPGLYIVGGGRVELLDDAGAVTDELGPGDFLYASEVMSASSAPITSRAAAGGALVLFANRHAAHELMVSVPPLLEILAS